MSSLKEVIKTVNSSQINCRKTAQTFIVHDYEKISWKKISQGTRKSQKNTKQKKILTKIQSSCKIRHSKQYIQSIFEAWEEATATRQDNVVVQMNVHLWQTTHTQNNIYCHALY